MKRKSLCEMNLRSRPPDHIKNLPQNLNQTVISLQEIDQTRSLLLDPPLQNSFPDRFSEKIQNFFEYLKYNEKTKYSMGKEEGVQEMISGYSLWDFKKVRDFTKKTKQRKFKDIALSPISPPPVQRTASLNVSAISPCSSGNKALHSAKKMQIESSFLLKTSEQIPAVVEKSGNELFSEPQSKIENSHSNKSKSGEEKTDLSDFKPLNEILINSLREEIDKFKQELVEKNAIIEDLNSKSADQEKKIADFHEKIETVSLVSKKNELLMEYLKEKEARLIECENKLKNLQTELTVSENCRVFLHNQIQELKGNLRIFCRIKPLHDSSLPIVSIPDTKNPTILELKNPNNSHSSYYFDHVFGTNSVQSEIFNEIVPFIQSAIDGEQVSILAYGQTGSGKTFTLEGDCNYDDEKISLGIESRGIMPRAVEFIFNEKKRLETIGKSIKFLFSIVEIYNENVSDLLNSENKPIINQTGNNRVALKNISLVEITELKQLFTLIKRANKSRVTDKTHYNECSSRSHCIYRINIIYLNEKEKEGVLNIVDLAGSERSSMQYLDDLPNEKDKEKVKKIQNEANFINKSLTTLGRIVRLISERQPLNIIPYRESKLTRLLQDCLGGNGKSLMFINVCANQENYFQTKESLKFSAKAVF